MCNSDETVLLPAGRMQGREFVFTRGLQAALTSAVVLCAALNEQ